MPDIDLDEADRCPHCGAILREPPNCCETAMLRHFNRLLPTDYADMEADYDIGGEG